LKGHEYLVFDKKEIDSANPASSKLIDLDRFIDFFQMDPHYFERTFLLIPNGSEGVVLIHYYQNAIVATTLRYPDEVKDPSRFSEMKDLPEVGEEELTRMTKIVDKMTTDLDLGAYNDGYKERIEALVESKMKGAEVHLEEKRPKKPAAKSMMEALRETAE
jgi:DNA end-binding protein Ku